MEFARDAFALSAPQGDGATLRTHLQRLYQNTRQADTRLLLQCPQECEPLWRVFNSLGRAGGSGLTPITQQEVQAWQANHSTRLRSWEVDTLFALDQLAATVAAQHRQANPDQ